MNDVNASLMNNLLGQLQAPRVSCDVSSAAPGRPCRVNFIFTHLSLTRSAVGCFDGLLTVASKIWSFPRHSFVYATA